MKSKPGSSSQNILEYSSVKKMEIIKTKNEELRTEKNLVSNFLVFQRKMAKIMEDSPINRCILPTIKDMPSRVPSVDPAKPHGEYQSWYG